MGTSTSSTNSPAVALGEQARTYDQAAELIAYRRLGADTERFAIAFSVAGTRVYTALTDLAFNGLALDKVTTLDVAPTDRYAISGELDAIAEAARAVQS